MTYQEKLNDMRRESAVLQKEFLNVVEEIRKLTDKNEPIDEELLFTRDKLYGRFNRILKEHRRLINLTESKHIPLSSEFSEMIFQMG